MELAIVVLLNDNVVKSSFKYSNYEYITMFHFKTDYIYNNGQERLHY